MMVVIRLNRMRPSCASSASLARLRRVVAHYVLGDPKAFAFSAGCAITSHFIETRPEVAKRFVAAWAKAVHFINDHPAEARQALAKNGLVPADIASSVPVHRYFICLLYTSPSPRD